MRNFFRDFELDIVTVLGGIIILCQVTIIVSVIIMSINH